MTFFCCTALLLAWCACAILLGPVPAAAQKPVFGLATGLGGLGDKAYNDMLYHGMVLARAMHGVLFHVESPSDPAQDMGVMEDLIAQGAKVIIAGGGYHMVEPVDVLAQRHPDVHFVLFDDVAKNFWPNVSSVTFKQNEGSYLCGVLAAKMSKTREIGFLGASDLQIINDFFVGYEAGAKSVQPDISISRVYIESSNEDVNPYNSPLRARRFALNMYDAGCDVIFAVASGSNKGVFSAALERQKFAIGVDSDQDHLAQGFILTSMMKRLDTAVVFAVSEYLAGRLDNKNYSLGLAEEGVSLSPMTFTRVLIPQQLHKEIEETKQGIQDNSIFVPSTLTDGQTGAR